MKSCLFILIAVFVLAGMCASLGTIYFMSSDTKVAEPQEEAAEAGETPQ